MTLSRIQPIVPVRLDKFDSEIESEKRRKNKNAKLTIKPEQSFSVVLSTTLNQKEK